MPEMTKLQEHYFRVRSKHLSCTREEFPERAATVDAHLLAAFQELGDVEDFADTTWHIGIAAIQKEEPKPLRNPNVHEP